MNISSRKLGLIENLKHIKSNTLYPWRFLQVDDLRAKTTHICLTKKGN